MEQKKLIRPKEFLNKGWRLWGLKKTSEKAVRNRYDGKTKRLH